MISVLSKGPTLTENYSFESHYLFFGFLGVFGWVFLIGWFFIVVLVWGFLLQDSIITSVMTLMQVSRKKTPAFIFSSFICPFLEYHLLENDASIDGEEKALNYSKTFWYTHHVWWHAWFLEGFILSLRLHPNGKSCLEGCGRVLALFLL